MPTINQYTDPLYNLEKGVANGAATLGGDGILTSAQRPSYTTAQVTESGNLYFTNTRVQTFGDTRYALQSTTITALGSGITGGGSLAANRTISLDFNYLDDRYLSGYKQKAPVRVATTANITLSAPQTIDGVAVIAGDRVLVKNQTAGETNGIYVVAAGAWTRATDFDMGSADEVSQGAAVFVQDGVTLGKTGWSLSTPDPITVGTTPLTFIQYAGANSYTAGTGLQLVGNVFSALNTTALWNANQLQGINISNVAPTNGQLIQYNGTSWIPFTPTYISGNQTITLSGDVTGSGTTAITTTVSAASVRTKLSAGTGISYNNSTGVITNASPDQTVVINGGIGIGVSGTYPNFTITNTAPNTIPNLSQVLTVGSAGGLSNITLGTAGNTTFTAYQNVRSVSSIDYTSSIGISAIPEISISLSNGTAAQNKALLIPFAGTTIQYTPNNGTNKYDVWHSNNHPAGSAFTPTLTGANVLSTMTVNSAGHISALTTRTLTPTDIGAAASNIPLSTVLTNGNTANNNIVLGANANVNQYAYQAIRSVGSVNYTATFAVAAGGTPGAYIGSSDGSGTNTKLLYVPYNFTAPRYSPDGGSNSYEMWHSNNHPAGGPANNGIFTGASVPALIASNSAGHITSVTARTLTPADIGAAPASASANYIQNTTSLQASSNFYISAIGRTDGSFQIRKDGSDVFNTSLYLANAANSRAFNIQLNGATVPGWSGWLHNGTTNIKRIEQFADNGLLRITADNGEGIRLFRPINVPNGGTGSVSFEYGNTLGTTNPVVYSQIYGQAVGVTAGAENGEIIFNTRNAGALAEKMRLNTVGVLTVQNDIVSTSAGSNGTITSRSTSTGDAIFTADVSGVSSTSIRTFRTGGRTGIINNTNEAITILTNANVGFGVVAPTAKVDIATTAGVEVGFTGAQAANIYHQTASQSLFINSNVAPIYIGANGSGTQQLNLLANGNVGVGVIAPTFKVHINSGTSATGVMAQATTALGTSSGAFLSGFATGVPTAANQRLGGLAIGTNTTGTTYVTGAQIEGWAEGAWTAGTSHPTAMLFKTTGSGENTISERMRISADGRVGINTATPDASVYLHVEGGIMGYGLKSPVTQTLTLQSQGDDIQFVVGGTVEAYMTSDGLGIGVVPTPARGAVLQAQGNVWSTDAYILGVTNTPKAEFYMAGNNAGVRTMDAVAQLTLDVGTTGSINAVRILPTGLVGIGGIATPTSTLHVNGSLATRTRVINTNTAQTVQATDHTLLFTGFSTGSTVTLNLPNPATCEGRELTIIENTASTLNLNFSVQRTTGPVLNALGGAGLSTTTIRVVNGSWWLISTF